MQRLISSDDNRRMLDRLSVNACIDFGRRNASSNLKRLNINATRNANLE